MEAGLCKQGSGEAQPSGGVVVARGHEHRAGARDADHRLLPRRHGGQ